MESGTKLNQIQTLLFIDYDLYNFFLGNPDFKVQIKKIFRNNICMTGSAKCASKRKYKKLFVLTSVLD